MPETFKAAGYQTAICGKWHLGHAYAKYLRIAGDSITPTGT
ncbi:MAG TPA: hypothetical protein VLE22_11865 [Bryobacteraceae bacterium]|nr:hypothetical protein [Bryobacteraceae bacterium]